MSDHGRWHAPRAKLPALASIRVRLTLWYVAILAVVLFIFSGLVYAGQARSIESDVQDQLRSAAQQLVATYDPRDGLLHPVFLAPGDSKSVPVAATVEARKGDFPIRIAKDEVKFDVEGAIYLLDPDGRVLQSLGLGENGKIPPQLPRKPLAGLQEYFFQAILADPSGEVRAYRFFVTPLLNSDASAGTLLIGQPDRTQEQLAQLRLTLLLATPATLLLAAIGGYWLATRAMRPVRLIDQAAAEIGATDLSRRLNLPQRDELGALAATFDAMLDRLEAAFARQRQFTADASHELRTPLSIVDLETTHALAAPRTPDEYARALATIQAENTRMTRLVTDLLLLARADAGQAPLGREPLDLSDLALAATERLEPLARQHHIELCLGDLPAIPITGDPHHLTQLLTNLIENGIIYTSGHGTHVRIETGTCPTATPPHAWLRVTDDGPGIPPADLPHLFDRFYRADPSRTPNAPGGSGLGLAIAAFIAQSHHGTLTVQSTPHYGTTFELHLPLS